MFSNSLQTYVWYDDSDSQQQLLLGRFDAWKDDEIIYNRSETFFWVYFLD